ncbi:8922_t:CDS:2 [Acaulospora morrowiae]|uniref:8922_t:CDS:1 n=1 Tax=Acaulospora morrowiae TaxID=94023 RepID=A0A9N9F5G1_9GLOM|nr:8922_t:CDS:2 [Acaulospora morrowiae]
MDLSIKLYSLAISEYELSVIPIEELKNKKKIGRGAFGSVFKCNIDRDIKMVAIKEISIGNDDESASIKNFLNELKLHSKAKSNRIIELFGISHDMDADSCYLVMELADGHLRKYLSDKKDELQWEEKIKIAVQLAEGVSYIHNVMKVAHRDLHTKNILMKHGDVKITDFGLSKNLNSVMSSKSDILGMLPFVDPQKLENSHYKTDTKSDIYSLGLLFWEISSCRVPFNKLDAAFVVKNIIENKREEPVVGTPLSFVKLYSICWNATPSLRLTADQVLKQIKSLSFEPVYNGVNITNENSSDTRGITSQTIL